MGWRGLAMLALLVVLGAAGGFAMSRGLSDVSVSGDAAEPVAATSPSVPGTTALRARPDPDYKPLLPDIELTTATLGNGRSAITYPVPVGWKANHSASNAVKWKKPKSPNNTYVMRVSDVRLREVTAEEEIAATIAEMDAKGPEKGFHIETQRSNSLEYTYLSTEGTRRYSFMHLVDLDDDDLVDVEVLVHGRQVDKLGAKDLVERVAAGVSVG